MNINEIVGAIGEIESVGDLNRISKAIKIRWREIQLEKVGEFRVGQKVFFKTKNGSLIRGRIEKLNRKTITVLADGGKGRWRVSPSLIEVE